MQGLTLKCVQTNLFWQDIQSNLKQIEQLLNANKTPADIIILPEMFSTGFSMETKLLAETMKGPTIQWMYEKSHAYGSAICGSLIIEEDGQYFNRFIWVDPEGRLYQYDKRHLFTLLGEHDHFTAGNEHTLIEYKGWKIQPFICYDLRFPIWCRNTVEADLQLFVANWPERRSGHWKSLLEVRAIENQCYVAGVNRTGEDNNEVPHSGDSGIYDYYGRELVTLCHSNGVFTETLTMKGLMECRKKFPFLGDRDQFIIL